MKFSTRARYGLRICFLLGIREGMLTPLSMLVKQTNLSEKYLEQILSKLKKGGVTEALRGTQGGYRLVKKANSITVNEILTALDDAFDIADCVLDGCCKDEYCPNKRIFRRLYDGINSILDNFTLTDMINEYKCTKGGIEQL